MDRILAAVEAMQEELQEARKQLDASEFEFGGHVLTAIMQESLKRRVTLAHSTGIRPVIDTGVQVQFQRIDAASCPLQESLAVSNKSQSEEQECISSAQDETQSKRDSFLDASLSSTKLICNAQDANWKTITVASGAYDTAKTTTDCKTEDEYQSIPQITSNVSEKADYKLMSASVSETRPVMAEQRPAEIENEDSQEVEKSSREAVDIRSVLSSVAPEKEASTIVQSALDENAEGNADLETSEFVGKEKRTVSSCESLETHDQAHEKETALSPAEHLEVRDNVDSPLSNVEEFPDKPSTVAKALLSRSESFSSNDAEQNHECRSRLEPQSHPKTTTNFISERDSMRSNKGHQEEEHGQLEGQPNDGVSHLYTEHKLDRTYLCYHSFTPRLKQTPSSSDKEVSQNDCGDSLSTDRRKEECSEDLERILGNAVELCQWESATRPAIRVPNRSENGSLRELLQLLQEKRTHAQDAFGELSEAIDALLSTKEVAAMPSLEHPELEHFTDQKKNLHAALLDLQNFPDSAKRDETHFRNAPHPTPLREPISDSDTSEEQPSDSNIPFNQKLTTNVNLAARERSEECFNSDSWIEIARSSAAGMKRDRIHSSCSMDSVLSELGHYLSTKMPARERWISAFHKIRRIRALSGHHWQSFGLTNSLQQQAHTKSTVKSNLEVFLYGLGTRTETADSIDSS